MSGPLIYRRTLGGAEFSPEDVVDLLYWYDFSDQSTMTLSGSNITAISDKSGNYNLVKPPTEPGPLLSTNVQNGLSVAKFEAAVTASSLISQSSFINTGRCLFAVTASLNVSSWSPVVMHRGNSGVSFGWNNVGLNRLFNVIENVRVDAGCTTIFTNNNFALYCGIWNTNNTSNTIYINGVSENTTVTAAYTNLSTLLYLGRSQGGRFSNVYIAEVIAPSVPITNEQRQLIETYLNDKWSIY